MEGNIFLNFIYPWPLYTTTTKALDEADYYNDSERWNRLNRTWYLTGQPYRSLDQIDGTPNPFFLRWLDHPSYDKYWQNMIAYREDFAGIDIPILSTDGYLGRSRESAPSTTSPNIKSTMHAPSTIFYLIGPYNRTWVLSACRRHVCGDMKSTLWPGSISRSCVISGSTMFYKATRATLLKTRSF